MEEEITKPLEEPEGERLHIVKPGESLSSIARKYYGPENEIHWVTIHNFNIDVIGDNPDSIQVGMELVIPDLTEFLM
jgi:nucleoid-associated protein YgaU